MASAAKRAKLQGPAPPPGAVSTFLTWCGEEGVELSHKVYVSREGTVANYGLVAREDIEAGEVLFTIPRGLLLSQHTSSLASLLEKERETLDSQSGWIPLLLCLLHESTASNSRWGPYLALWPDFCDLDQPMFWSEEERMWLLRGTGILEAVDKDLANIQLEYSSIVLPFLKAHSDVFNPEVHTLELYKKLVAFVMAYSFQEPLAEEEEEEGEQPNPPVMVPVADLLNHVANHNANLEYSPECLQMVCTRPIGKGQEVFNTYGQMANWQLLHMYGFAEPYPGNTNESADIQMETMYKAALQAAKTEAEQQLVLEQWALLCQLELVGSEGAFVIGWESVFTEEELAMALKVLNLSAKEFKAFKEQVTGEGIDSYLTLTKAMIPGLQPSWKKLLSNTTWLTLELYNSDLKAEEDLLNDQKAYVKLSGREQFALHVRYGQKRILHQLLELAQ